MSLSARLLLAFVVVTALLVIPTGYATIHLAELEELAVAERGDHAAASLAIGRFDASLNRLDLYLRSYLATTDPDLSGELGLIMEELHDQASRVNGSASPPPSGGLVPVVEALDVSVAQIREAAREGRVSEATLAFRAIQPLVETARQRVTAAAEALDRRAAEDFVRADRIIASARSGTLGALFLALVAAGLVGVWATRLFTEPLRRLSYATADVAEGDFHSPEELPYERDDEIGDLSRSFRAMTQRLSELDRMKAEFMGVASHELKTPLNVIMGYAELIDEELAGSVSEHQHEILNAIAEQCQAMIRLVSRLMDISRLEAGGYQLHLERVHVEDLLTGLNRAFDLMAERERVTLTTRTEPSAPPTLIADIDIVRDEILGNLVSNALKFTPPGGDVVVSVRRSADADAVIFRVSDTGPGIPPEHRIHIFDRYYQVDRSRRVGSGLGLAIVQKMAEAHGGSVSLVEGGRGGAVFEVRLPLASVEAAPSEVAPIVEQWVAAE